MRARIVKIGNSRGIRIPKIVLEQSRLKDEVEIQVQDEQIVITPLQKPRAGWDEAFREMAKRGDDKLLDAPLPSLTRWDEEEWEW
jgi:antitoxin MazE